MGRMKRFVVAYEDHCLYLCDLDNNDNNYLRFEGITYYDVSSEIIKYINSKIKCNSIIYWRHFDEYYKDTIQYLLLNGYSNVDVKLKDGKTESVAKNKMVEWTMSYLVVKNKGIYRLFYKNGSGYVVDVHNLDKLIDLNNTDLGDFSNSYSVVNRVVDAVKFFRDNDLLGYLTIGAAAYSKLLKTIKTNQTLADKYHERDQYLVDKLFPSLKYTLRELNGKTVWDYIQYAYRGGLCYCPTKNLRVKHQKLTCYDACSMYPSVMHSKSNNYYPVGIPFLSKNKPDNIDEYYWFIYVDLDLILKKDGIDFLNIGKARCRLPFYLTCTDYELVLSNYKIYYQKVNNYLLFNKEIGLFDEYIDHWYNIKKTSTGGMRRIAKLMNNNIHGKFGSKIYGTTMCFKLNDDNNLDKPLEINSARDDKYIPIGAAVFSYARAVLIKAIKDNRDYFVYCDTDSLWLIGDVDPVGIKLGIELGEWKIEHQCYDALFISEKRYIIKEGWFDKEFNKTMDYRVIWSGLAGYRANLLITALMVSDRGKNPFNVSDNLYKFYNQMLTLDKIYLECEKNHSLLVVKYNKNEEEGFKDLVVSKILNIPKLKEVA